MIQALALTSDTLPAAVASTVNQITGSFSSILNWWFIPAVVGLFGAGIAIGLVLKFFNKRRGRRR